MLQTNPIILKQLFADETLFWVKVSAITMQTPQEQDIVVVPPPKNTHATIPKVTPVLSATQGGDSTYASLGYKHKVLLLISQPRAVELEHKQKTLLVKILAAVNLSLQETDLINIDTLPADTNFKDLLGAKSVHHFITFGVPLKRLSLNILLTPYQINRIEGCNFLMADTLENLDTDLQKKRALWECLKKMFRV